MRIVKGGLLGEQRTRTTLMYQWITYGVGTVLLLVAILAPDESRDIESRAGRAFTLVIGVLVLYHGWIYQPVTIFLLTTEAIVGTKLVNNYQPVTICFFYQKVNKKIP